MEKMANGLTALTVGEILDAIDAERNNPNVQNDKTNKAKILRKLDFAESFLLNIPESVIFEVEGVRGNGLKRSFFLPNMGSVIECALNYYIPKEKPARVSKSMKKHDSVLGCFDWEVKASIAPNAKATPSQEEITILVNLCGVFTIKKADVMQYTDKQGRLPHNQECGKWAQDWLLDKIGIDWERE